MKKQCQNVMLYFYQEMEEAQKTAFEAHLSECTSCQKELLFLQQTQKALTPASAPEDLINSLFEKTRPVRFWHKIFKPALAFASMGLIGICWFMKGSGLEYQTTNPSVNWVDCLTMKTDGQYNSFVEDFEVFENEF